MEHAEATVKARLAHVINWILSTGYFPQRWKLGEMMFLRPGGKDHRLPESDSSLQLCELRGRRNEYGSVVNVAFTT
ncbi:unnamed protein product [Acanthoscelides obtectus]|uniref:Uncharacterized protein n=1 Tax=Acanthoscelides obtectus TaxID=200917 RepID=A0A9P0P626_ACAOB|nr:unnamed protein product [Acanthoscelides obtectus]CAK1657596.1 hypothetical protein AOBTE_LOCUS20439 [Acanthoscelides obtectus]